MSDSPYIPFYPSDWLAGTRGLSAAETGVYITLIAMMYEREAPLDFSPARLARLCNIPAGGFHRALQALIEQDKIIKTDAGLWNRRVGEEVDKRSHKRRVATQNGSQNGASHGKKDKQKQRAGKAIQNQSQNQRDTNVSLMRVLAQAVSAEVAEEFVAHRREIRKPLTERACRGIVNKLDGHPDPDAVLQESITNGWQGVFPDRVKASPRLNGQATQIGTRKRVGSELREYRGSVDGWVRIYEDEDEDDGDSMGNPAGSRDHDQGDERDATDDVPRMQSAPAEETRHMLGSDVQAGWRSMDVPPLRLVGGSLL